MSVGYPAVQELVHGRVNLARRRRHIGRAELGLEDDLMDRMGGGLDEQLE